MDIGQGMDTAMGIKLMTEFSNKDVPGDNGKNKMKQTTPHPKKTVSVTQEIRRQMWVAGGKGQSKSGKRVWGQTSWYLTLNERVAKKSWMQGTLPNYIDMWWFIFINFN